MGQRSLPSRHVQEHDSAEAGYPVREGDRGIGRSRRSPLGPVGGDHRRDSRSSTSMTLVGESEQLRSAAGPMVPAHHRLLSVCCRTPVGLHLPYAQVLTDSGARVVFAEDDVQIAKLRGQPERLPDVIRVITFDGVTDGDWPSARSSSAQDHRATPRSLLDSMDVSS
jgi:hypothetical protein